MVCGCSVINNYLFANRFGCQRRISIYIRKNESPYSYGDNVNFVSFISTEVFFKIFFGLLNKAWGIGCLTGIG